MKVARGRTLGALARSNVLLVSLDRKGASYRYHPLFREMLTPSCVDSTRSSSGSFTRARVWYEEHGDIDAAIEHAVSAGDPELSGELLWRHASSYIGHGGNEALRGWLSHFTDDQLAAVPALAVTAAASGSPPAKGTRCAIGCRPRPVPHPLRPSNTRSTAPPCSCVPCSRSTAWHRWAVTRRASALSSENGSTRAFARLLEGTAHQLAGDRMRARAALDDGARRARYRLRARPGTLPRPARAAEADEDWDAATTLSERARSRVEGCGLGAYPIVALVYAVSALARSHAGSVEDASRPPRRSSSLTARLVDFVPWYEAETRVVLARASLGLSDVAGARSLLAEANRMVRRIPRPPRSVPGSPRHTPSLRLPQALPRRSHAHGGRTARAAASAHPSLSFPAIAKRLFVSTNTVKPTFGLCIVSSTHHRARTVSARGRRRSARRTLGA